MMDIANTIGAAVVVTQQVSQQINPQQDRTSAVGVAADNNLSVQRQILDETQNSVQGQGAARNSANGENSASNDGAKGGGQDQDNATATSLNGGVGANLDITA